MPGDFLFQNPGQGVDFSRRGNFLALVFCTLVFFTGIMLSGAEIGSIKFEQTNQYKFPEQMLRFNVQEKVGDKFDKKVLNEDIKRLYSSGYFSDVVSETSTSPDGKINIVIKVSAKPRINKIILKGNKKFKDNELMKLITLVPDVPLSDKRLKDSATALRNFYAQKGYSEAKIYPKVVNVGKGDVNVVFTINEHLRLKINDVTFEGNTVFSNWDLRHSIANQHSYLSWLSVLDIGLLNKPELENDKLRLREMYWNKGYLDFKVEKVTITADKEDPEYVNINFKLFEGKPYTITKVFITGNKHFTEAQLLPLVEGLSGTVYSQTQVNMGRDELENMYHPLGYANVMCRVIRIPDYKTHTVEVEFRMFEGRIYHVRDIKITGNKVTKEYVIRRELVIQPDDPLDKNRIEASKARLMGMGYFDNVEAVSVNTGTTGEKDLNFRVKEKRTAYFKIGAGFSDTDSLVGMVELNQSNFDLFDPENYFQGGGQRLRLQGFFGLTRMDANIDFTEPWLFGMPLRLDVNGYINNVVYDDWSERRIGAHIGLSKQIFDDFTTIGAGYRFEQVRVHNVDDDDPYLQQYKGNEYVSKLSLSISRDTRNSLTNPTSGYHLMGTAEMSPKPLGSSHNFYRLELKASQYFSFWDDIFIGHVGAKWGAVCSFDRNEPVPLYERYFLGGGDSLRGFPYRGVSPVDNNKNNIGGGSMALATCEITHPIWEFIRGAVFVDAGMVEDLAYNFNLNDLCVGAGYGLRIKVPYLNAPIKVDLAYPIVNNQQHLRSKFRIHFNMGFVW